jgi:exopolysaccharide production protein ExoY
VFPLKDTRHLTVEKPMFPTVLSAKICPYAAETGPWLRVIYGTERLGAALALLVLSPLVAALAIAIIALSRRSPLVRHTRVGWRGAPLRMLKFRTMWGEGNPVAPMCAIEDVFGAVPGSKSAGDARVTSSFASFCRRHSLDELPQLYHVVRGEMSLVGPRPITSAELRDHYGECAGEVLSVRPGLTGLWQIKGRSQLSYARRKRLDLIFVRRLSARLYFGILLRSVPKVLSGDDAC